MVIKIINSNGYKIYIQAFKIVFVQKNSLLKYFFIDIIINFCYIMFHNFRLYKFKDINMVFFPEDEDSKQEKKNFVNIEVNFDTKLYELIY